MAKTDKSGTQEDNPEVKSEYLSQSTTSSKIKASDENVDGHNNNNVVKEKDKEPCFQLKTNKSLFTMQNFSKWLVIFIPSILVTSCQCSPLPSRSEGHTGGFALADTNCICTVNYKARLEILGRTDIQDQNISPLLFFNLRQIGGYPRVVVQCHCERNLTTDKIPSLISDGRPLADMGYWTNKVNASQLMSHLVCSRMFDDENHGFQFVLCQDGTKDTTTNSVHTDVTSTKAAADITLAGTTITTVQVQTHLDTETHGGTDTGIKEDNSETSTATVIIITVVVICTMFFLILFLIGYCIKRQCCFKLKKIPQI